MDTSDEGISDHDRKPSKPKDAAKSRWGHIRQHRNQAKNTLSAVITLPPSVLSSKSNGDEQGESMTIPEIRQVGICPFDGPDDQKRAAKNNLQCTVEIDPVSGHKTVALRSSVRLYNNTEVDLIVFVERKLTPHQVRLWSTNRT